MRARIAIMACALLGPAPAWAACDGPPYNQFDFWLGAWHDPATPAGEQYQVRRIAGGCAVEELLVGAAGQIQGAGLAGWDSERKQWRQLWADADGIVTVYLGGPVADGSFVVTSEPKTGGTRWRYTYRNIQPDRMDADYASGPSDNGPWTSVWTGHFDRIAPPQQ